MKNRGKIIGLLVSIALFVLLIIVGMTYYKRSHNVEENKTINGIIDNETRDDLDIDAGIQKIEGAESNPTADSVSMDDEADDIDQPEMLTFVDVFGEEYQTEIIESALKHEYDLEKFQHEGYKLTYEDDERYSRLGVDVSEHQGYIDWKKVKEDGYDFAFLRIGYRGYGQTGSINLDQKFDENIRNAHEAGIDIGVYFFSQAINEQEAAEEAQFVISHLENYHLELPVVYDPESILDDEARTDNVSGEQFTKNTLTFCEMISNAGYDSMIYSNMLWEAFEFDMEQVDKYPFWYADYELLPQTPYAFDFWQYTNEGYVNGISGAVDIDIQLIDKY